MSPTVIVDDTDPGIQYVGSWSQDLLGPHYTEGNFGDPYGNTLHFTNSDGSFSYIFEGTQVTVTGTVQYPGGATPNPAWVCSVDGTLIPTKNYNSASNRLDLCDTDNLSDGTHNITVQVISSDQHTFWFDYFQYTPSDKVDLADAVLSFDHTDPQINLTWYGFYDNTLPLAPTTATYTINGQAPVSFNLNGSAAQATGIQYNQIFFQTHQLSPGNHSIQVVYQGNSTFVPLSLNSIVVQHSSINTHVYSAIGVRQPTSTPASDHSINTGAVIGGALGGLALLVALGMAFLFWHLRRKHSKDGKHKYLVVDPGDPTPMATASESGVPASLHFNGGIPSSARLTLANQTSSTPTSYNGRLSVAKPVDRTASQSSAAHTTSGPNNSKALEAQHDAVNSFTPIRLDPPNRRSRSSNATSGDFSHATVVRDEDSGFRFWQTPEGGQVQVLPPGYTPV
ncbi:hypothetical protein CPB84DRAFT_1841851 [Gymnopilus junonius]|uniref:Transmembrane protein n=1 Tax=Gymnopilus junonius TaxID=109634 RepID=A0A9P5P276_GYMJU|nr:hypothetical protein CPB84DRAFT_1841851 [Gymnopilus junonius]